MSTKIREDFVLSKTPSFHSFAPDANGIVYDDTDHARFPSRIHTFTNPGNLSFVDVAASIYGFVSSGVLKVLRIADGREYQVGEGEYFSFGEGVEISGQAVGLVVERIGEKVFNLIGGPIEAKGRLKYIDGCSDSLLLAPVKYGMSCLNHLHFPPNIRQTMHTHPTVRAGMIARGEGICHTPFGDLPLVKNNPFVILPRDEITDGRHCFNTGDGTMDVIAYHPDSDFGPSDENHPMINRTIVDGVPASQIDGIRTMDL